MMCRVTAPWTAMFRRDAASRSPFRHFVRADRLLRIARHRALRWFNDPIAITERERRAREVGPSMWQHQFPSGTLH